MSGMVYLKNVATLKLDAETCNGCGICLTVCPHEVFIAINGVVRISDLDSCIECGACALNCPVEALEVRVGVGCAAAVINGALGRDSSSCCCVVETDGNDAGRTSCC